MKSMLLLSVATFLFPTHFPSAAAAEQCVSTPGICQIADTSWAPDCNAFNAGDDDTHEFSGKSEVTVTAPGVTKSFGFQPPTGCKALPAAISTDYYQKALNLANQLKAAGICVFILDNVANP